MDSGGGTDITGSRYIKSYTARGFIDAVAGSIELNARRCRRKQSHCDELWRLDWTRKERRVSRRIDFCDLADLKSGAGGRDVEITFQVKGHAFWETETTREGTLVSGRIELRNGPIAVVAREQPAADVKGQTYRKISGIGEESGIASRIEFFDRVATTVRGVKVPTSIERQSARTAQP
jgi:hypothetical protein